MREQDLQINKLKSAIRAKVNKKFLNNYSAEEKM
jgi:hypothetical protein